MQLKRAIIHSCTGGAGNHFRWLLMLDPEFYIFDGGPVADKVSYILDKVYPPTRSRYNWFEFDLKYRIWLNDQIRLSHTNFDPGWQNRRGQFDSKVNFFCYPKNLKILIDLYTKLGDRSYELEQERINAIERDTVEAVKCVDIFGGLIVNANRFFVPELDKELYDEFCNFGNFNNLYDNARIIHQAWYAARNRNSKQIVTLSPLLCPHSVTEIS